MYVNDFMFKKKMISNKPISLWNKIYILFKNLFEPNINNKFDYGDFTIFEMRFILPLAFTGICFSFFNIIVNIWSGFNTTLIIIPVITFFSFGIIFYYGKRPVLNPTYLKWSLFFLILAIINSLWIYNYGSEGPALYLFVLLYSYMIFMWKGKDLIFVTIIVFLNVLGLYLLDNYYSGITGDYISKKAQIIDVYTSLYYYGIIMFILMYVAKSSYIKAYTDARKANKLKSSFMANMSHEIKTPLNAIIGFTGLLVRTDNTVEEKQKYIRIINESNDTLLRLVKDILDISLIESNQMLLSGKEVNITQMLENLAETYNLLINEKNESNVVITKDIPNKNYFLNTDDIRLRQILTNLLNNALKYTSHGFITIGVKERKYFLEFYVKDTGIGIAKSYQDKLFDRFYKINYKHNGILTGVGIGLYLCKKIVEIMGGTIWVKSTPDVGSIFSFTIPKKDFRKEERQNLIPVYNNDSKINQPLFEKKLKILVVEDHPASLLLLTKMLSEINAEILQAFNGEMALEMLKAHNDINLILLDIKLPFMSGYEVIKKIKNMNDRVPVVAQTAYAMDKDKELIYKAGFDALITKPIDKKLLFNIIRGLGLLYK